MVHLVLVNHKLHNPEPGFTSKFMLAIVNTPVFQGSMEGSYNADEWATRLYVRSLDDGSCATDVIFNSCLGVELGRGRTAHGSPTFRHQITTSP